MAKLKVSGSASGTGTITLIAPATSTDRTITLPDESITLGGGATGLDDVSGVARATSGLLFNGDTVAANTLDDYEEGTFTATMNGATATYTHNTGYYTKIGDRVHINLYLVINTFTSTGSTRINIAGLPFTSKAIYVGDGHYPISITRYGSLNVSAIAFYPMVVDNSTFMKMDSSSTSSNSTTSNIEFATAGAMVRLAGTYLAA
jgi:hypothetical protein